MAKAVHEEKRYLVEEKSIVEFSNDSSLCGGIVDIWEGIRRRLDV